MSISCITTLVPRKSKVSQALLLLQKATTTLLPECTVKFLAAVFFILHGIVEADVEEITTSKSRHDYGLSKGIRLPSKTAH